MKVPAAVAVSGRAVPETEVAVVISGADLQARLEQARHHCRTYHWRLVVQQAVWLRLLEAASQERQP